MILPGISIVIVTYNSGAFIRECLNSIFSSLSQISCQVIIVDNDSSDEGNNFLQEKFPQVKLMNNPHNLGFAAACNQGAAVSSEEFILFLNPDTILKKKSIERCLKFLLSNPEAGIVGCKLLHPDGRLQPSCADFPYLHRLVLDHALRCGLFPALHQRMLIKYWRHDDIRQVDWVLGAFMLMKTDKYRQIGGFDEDFFLYGEDMDLCYRMHLSGWKTVFYSYAEIIHIGNPVWDAERLTRVYDAYIRFYSKHFSGSDMCLLRMLINMKWLIATLLKTQKSLSHRVNS